jgi:hypothetical protein
MLQVPELQSRRAEPWLARLRYAYAEALTAVGRGEEARDWFALAAEVDLDGETDAAERILELDGVILEDDELEDDELEDDELEDDELEDFESVDGGPSEEDGASEDGGEAGHYGETGDDQPEYGLQADGPTEPDVAEAGEAEDDKPDLDDRGGVA